MSQYLPFSWSARYFVLILMLAGHAVAARGAGTSEVVRLRYNATMNLLDVSGRAPSKGRRPDGGWYRDREDLGTLKYMLYKAQKRPLIEKIEVSVDELEFRGQEASPTQELLAKRVARELLRSGKRQVAGTNLPYSEGAVGQMKRTIRALNRMWDDRRQGLNSKWTAEAYLAVDVDVGGSGIEIVGSHTVLWTIFRDGELLVKPSEVGF